jgi:hypothetical protein
MLQLYEFKPTNNYPSRAFYTHNIGIPEIAKDYSLLINIRNPYSHLVSTWYYDHTRNKTSITELTFEQYVRNVCFKQIYTSSRASIKDHFFPEICNIIVNTKTDYMFIKYEQLAEDIKKIPFIDFNNQNIQTCYEEYILKNHFNESSTIVGELRKDNSQLKLTDWRSYYTDELADIVYTYKKKQFELFKYEKNSWKQQF